MRFTRWFAAIVIALIALVSVLVLITAQVGAVSCDEEECGVVAEYAPPKVSAHKFAPKPEVSEPKPNHMTYHLAMSTVSEIAEQLDYVLDSMYITDDDVVEVFDYSELTAEVLQNRAGKWIIEIVYGTCVSEWGDGRTIDGYFITYAGVSGVELGKQYRTFMVYDPTNGYIDDIMERFDFEVSY